MKIWKLLSVIVFSLAPVAAGAQFYVIGDDPGSVKWQTISTAHYKIVYPAGMDSLARAYGRSLEQFQPYVGTSMGYEPGEYTRRRVPVILHAYNSVSNGSVAWAPKRMDLFTTPDAYSPEPMPWMDNLTIHEQRHVAQMQVGLSPGAFQALGYIFGEMWDGAVAGIYLTGFIEGDAVVAETALSRSGRGRTADFLNYYMISFDNGEPRNMYRWRLGSQRLYTPDKYAWGYFFLSGMRYIYDNPDFLAHYYRHMALRPYDFWGFARTIENETGHKTKEVFREVTDTMRTMWGKEIEARAPYTPYDETVRHERRYVRYSGLTAAGDEVYAIRSGIARPASLVKVDSLGKLKNVRAFPAVSSKLDYDPSLRRLYWSEYKYTRWGLKTYSAIRYYDLELGKASSLSKKDRLFNPASSPDGTVLSVTRYNEAGGSQLAVLSADSGKEVSRASAPDSLQIVESAWAGGRIYISALSPGGAGLYSIGYGFDRDSTFRFTGEWREEMAPQPAKIDGLRAAGTLLHFASDRLGVKELYTFNIASRELLRLTSSKYGAEDYSFNEAGDTLYYSLKQYDGDYLVSTPTDSLFSVRTAPDSLYKWVLADNLTRQETGLSASAGKRFLSADPDTVQFTDPKRYRKGGHLFNIHSWAPIYFNVDNIMSMSYDYYYDLASLGVAAISQNQLGTAITQLGYGAHKDPYDRGKWRHSGHLNFTYTGWFPVIEASVDFNDRAARDYSYVLFTNAARSTQFLNSSRLRNAPYLTGYVSVYIPFSFSRGGMSSGFIPQLTYSVGNDSLTKTKGVQPGGVKPDTDGMSFTREEVVILQRLTAAARIYTMRPTADSGVYPRWGIGAELGAAFRPGLTDYFAPAGYFYLYGYVPGFSLTQGLNLSVMFQTILSGNSVFGESVVNTLPRGLADNSYLSSFFSEYALRSAKFSADYAIPISTGDVAVAGYLLYFSRLILTPHFDYTAISWSSSCPFQGGLFSVGASLTVDLRSTICIKVPFQIGVSCSYNGGSAFSSLNPYLASYGSALSHFYIGPVFSISLN